MYSTSFAVGALAGIALAGALAIAATPKQEPPPAARALQQPVSTLYRYGVPEQTADFAANESAAASVPPRDQQE